jgi:redox-sensitive bicupin YhaK (pirin superfamily)
MKVIKRSQDRGRGDHGWLSSYHTFSFGDYYDPDNMGFGSLRVINEDRVAPGMGFGTHPHNNMEIFSYVIEGELAHKDSMGNGRTIRAGELQAMSAGTGVAHSEFNPSSDTPVHFLQIWIVPNERNLTPSYAEWKPTSGERSPLTLVVSPDAREGSLKVHQDVEMYLGSLKGPQKVLFPIAKGKSVWLQTIKGELKVGEDLLRSGDAMSFVDEEGLEVATDTNAEFMLFRL